MRICQLIDVLDVGGAGIAASRISNVITQNNNNEVLQISSSNSNNNSCSLENSRKFQFLNLFSNFLNNSFYTFVRNQDLNQQLSKLLNREKPDIINVHNIHSAGWPISLVQTCLDHAPVVWTLHDCWSFLGSYYPKHTPPVNKSLKCNLDEFWKTPSLRLTAVTPSSWMKTEATQSFWRNNQIKVVPNPVPNTYLEIKNRLACKRALGLKEGIPTIMCIAGNLSAERKGGPILEEILKSKITEEAQFILFGCGHGFHDENIKSFGFIKDELTIQIAYQAADILLHAAPVDNLPNTVAESICCGTPVLAFKTGGIPEMVITNKSGWLVDKISAELLCQELTKIIHTNSFKKLRESTRQIGCKLFDEQNIAEEYGYAFNSALN